jgi:signal peptidase I
MDDESRGTIYQDIAQDLVRESLSLHGFTRLRVISDSMSPMINVDDFVVIEQTSRKEYERGDIVVIDRKGKFVTHRLVRLGEDKWYTKGDRFHSLDEPISIDDLIGRVVQIDRKDNQLNLKCRKWRRINRFRGWLANIEVGIYRSAKWLRRKFQLM